MKSNISEFNGLLTKQKLKWEETGLFQRSSRYIPKIGDASEILEAAFRLKKNQFADRYYHVQNHYYIVRIKQREIPDPKTFSKEKEKSLEALLSKKQTDVYFEWLKELRDSAKISIRKQAFEES